MSTMLPGSSGNDEIRTPKRLFAKLNTAFQFSYDAFATEKNALCRSFSTTEGTFWRGQFYSAETGLSIPWEGQRVFMNPPYSRPLLSQCIEKAVEERNNAAIIVALVKVDTSTKWFQLLMQYAHIDYLPKRLKYEGMTAAATFPSAIAVFKKDWVNA